MVQETSNSCKIPVQFPQSPLVTGWFGVSNESLCWTETECLCLMQLQLREPKISHCNSCSGICHIFQLFSNKSNRSCACPVLSAPPQLRFERRWHNKPLAHFHIWLYFEHTFCLFPLQCQHKLRADMHCCLSAVLSLTCCSCDSSKRHRATQHLAMFRNEDRR